MRKRKENKKYLVNEVGESPAEFIEQPTRTDTPDAENLEPRRTTTALFSFADGRCFASPRPYDETHTTLDVFSSLMSRWFRRRGHGPGLP
jgi:hypothetical protein